MNQLPKIIIGDLITDNRGTINYNNSFDASKIKRMYIIQNNNIDFVRGWQGHKIEERWFLVIEGSFEINLIRVDNWKTPSKFLKSDKYILSSEKMDVLHVPPGYISSIRSNEQASKLLAMSNYKNGEVNDEYRFHIDYFKLSHNQK